MSAHRSWLGINPAMCLKDSDAPPSDVDKHTLADRPVKE